MSTFELEHTGFLAVTGTGKSHEVKRRLSALPSAHSRVIVVSPVDEWSTTSPERKGPLKDAMTLAQFKADPMKLFERHLALALYGFDPLDPRPAAAAVRLIARLQARHKQDTGKVPPRLLLVIDEAGPIARHCLRELEGLATAGGQHLGITLWLIAQRPSLIPITARSQLKVLVVGHLSEPADVEAVTERARDPELGAKIAALPDKFSPELGTYPFLEIRPSQSSAPRVPPSKATRPPAAAHPSSPPANPPQKEATS